MFLTPFITFSVAVAAATVLLVALGHRVRLASRFLGLSGYRSFRYHQKTRETRAPTDFT